MKKRLLSILLTACLLVGLLPTVALAAEDGVKYLDDKGVEQIYTGSYTEITQEYTDWGYLTTGWYVVNSNVTFGGNPSVKGDVHLILADNCSLSLGCLYVASGNSLTIYAQSTDKDTMGRLVAQYENESVGIGGHGHGGTITINGGKNTASGMRGAGIGGGGGPIAGNGGIVTINGGIVTATSTYGAGIGGGGRPGSSGDGGVITINGGTVIATSTYGAGIGGGSHGGGNGGDGGKITINGGTVIATSTHGAGIGGGCGKYKCGNGADVTITGGTVTATTTNQNIAAIGWGDGNTDPGGRSPGTLIITGGIVNATSKADTGIKPTDSNNLEVYGNLTLPMELAPLFIPQSESRTPPQVSWA